MRNKEEELQAELNMATMRVSDLKQTLQNTKSYYDAHRGAGGDAKGVGGGTTINKAMKGGIAVNNGNGLGPIVSNTIDSEDDESDDDSVDKFDEAEEDESYEEVS